ncbi:MAG TPA: hypothetical protein VF990_17290 [Candidatus Dormibacteraeota bacterium]
MHGGQSSASHPEKKRSQAAISRSRWSIAAMIASMGGGRRLLGMVDRAAGY